MSDNLSPEQWYNRENPVAPRAGARFTLIELLVIIAILAILIGLLLPGMKRGPTPRGSFQGKHYAYWSNKLESNNAQDRREAIAAFCAILRDPKTRERWYFVRYLSMECPEAKDALPTLKALADDPDPLVRQHAREVIRNLDPAEYERLNRSGK